MQRALAIFGEIREAGHRQAVVVAHGGLLSAAIKALLGIPAERNPFTFLNGSISKIGWDKDVKLLALEPGRPFARRDGGRRRLARRAWINAASVFQLENHFDLGRDIAGERAHADGAARRRCPVLRPRYRETTRCSR